MAMAARAPSTASTPSTASAPNTGPRRLESSVGQEESLGRQPWAEARRRTGPRWNLATQSNIFRSHSDGISNFSVWGQDVVSISRNKIALTSLSRPESEIGHQQLALQNLYSADRGVKHKNLSVLSTIAVLPLSRLFVVGTEDGFLKMCH
ncbi:Protein GFS12 [Zea mays]|uniref:Protein GFS12 n=1 Tax=Zea mays TaxID=4577 RepID=A0A1D6MSC9_MAIZE|nr:Protein GFS12 [Zea mays]